MNRVSRKIFVTLLLAMSASCLHLIGVENDIFQNDGITFDETPTSDDEITFIRGEISDIIPSDEIEIDEEVQMTPVEIEEEFYDENKTTSKREEHEDKGIEAKSGILKIRSHVDDIAEFNKAVERELARKDILMKRYQDQSRRMAKIQHEIRRHEEKYNQHQKNKIPKFPHNHQTTLDNKPKPIENFWTVLCGIGRAIFGNIMKFLGINI